MSGRGRPTKPLNKDLTVRIQKLIERGITMTTVAKLAELSTATVSRSVASGRISVLAAKQLEPVVRRFEAAQAGKNKTEEALHLLRKLSILLPAVLDELGERTGAALEG